MVPVILLAGLALMLATMHTEIPRDQEVRFVLSSTNRNVRSVRMAYSEAGEPVSAVEFWPNVDAPTSAPLIHKPSLKPGAYDLAIDIEEANGVVHSLSRRLVVPSDPLTIYLPVPAP